jgi:heptosyltransferase-2
LYAYSSDADKVSADDFIRKNGISGKRLVGMVAGAGKSWGAEAFYRRWDPENFAYVGRGLCLSGDIRVIIFGTGEESKICDFIVKSIGCGAISLCGATSLGFLVEMMSRCELVLCNEGGPLHIAVSQDVKTISIFGPVDDKVYGPYPASEKHIVVRAEGVECRPCYTNFKHAVCDDRKCLKNISKEKVLELAKRSLGL